MRKSVLIFGSFLLACFSVIMFGDENLWANSLCGSYLKTYNEKFLQNDIASCTIGTWLGTTSSDWNNASNWCGNTIPSSIINVKIPPGGNQPIISSSAQCGSITIESGATLTITGSNTLEVNGDWKNYGNFIANMSTVIINGVTQGISTINSSPNSQIFYNLILSSGTIEFNVPVQIGKLTIIEKAKCKLLSDGSVANELILGKYGQVEGSWGGTTSGATYKNELYFFSTIYKLIVTNNASLPGTWIGITSEWTKASNWSDGMVPTRLTDAIITATNYDPIITSSASCKNLFILPGCSLQIKDNNTLSVTQNWDNQGTFTPNSGTVVFDGADQVIRKKTTLNNVFKNITFGGSGVKTVNFEDHVTGILSIEGTASLSNAIGFLSTAILQYNTTTDRTTSFEWPESINITEVIIKNAGIISLDSKRVLNNTNLTISQGSTLDLNKFILSSNGIIRLECGGQTAGSIIKGSNYLSPNGSVMVVNSGKGSGAAVIECPIDISSCNFNVSHGNTSIMNPTDLWVNDITNIGNLTKSGSGIISIRGTVSLYSLKISAGNLTVQPTGAMTIYNLTNDVGASGLTLLSDATGTGSLILKNPTTSQATVQRYMTSGAWHLVSVPVTGQTIGSFLRGNTAIPTPVGATDPRAMRAYDPAANQWGEFFNSTNANQIITGTGYCMRVKASAANHEVVFTGALQAGDIPVNGLSEGKWNCIGNPYTSAITVTSAATDVTNFLTMNAITNKNIDPAYGIYIWDKTDAANGQTGQYTAISNVNSFGTNYPVQQGQGFMVKMASGKTSVSFTKAMQVHDPSLSLKSTEDIWPTITLIASADSVNSSTVIAFHEGMTNGLDVTYDAGLLKSGGPMELYTRLVDDYGIPFAIQALASDQYDRLIIPVGVDYSKGGKVSFSAESFYLPASCRPILEDRLTGLFTDLSDNPYTTDLTSSTAGTGRFFLHTSYTTTKAKSLSIKPLYYAKFIGKCQLRIQSSSSKSANATLLDIGGKHIASWKMMQDQDQTIDIPILKSGMYVLHIQSDGFSEVLKLANFF